MIDEEEKGKNLNPEKKIEEIVFPAEWVSKNPPGEDILKEEESERDTEYDVAKASEVARNFIRDNVGSLIAHDFRIEQIKQNGSKTRYIVLCSIVPDVGEDRDYYLIRVNVTDGKLVLPVGKGKRDKQTRKVSLEEFDVGDKWKE